MATETTTTTLEIQQIRKLRKSCLKSPSPIASRSNSSERCPTTSTTMNNSSRSTTPMPMSTQDAATKHVSFDESECIVFTADDWDRTPTEPARKLSYQDLLELKEIQKSLPRAIQPHDPLSTRNKRFLTSVPIELLPLLPSDAPPEPEPSTTPNSSPVSSASSSGTSTPLDTESPPFTTDAPAAKPAVTYTAPSSLFPHGIRIQRTAPPPPPHQAGGPRPCFRPSPSLFRPPAPAIVNHPTVRGYPSPTSPSSASTPSPGPAPSSPSPSSAKSAPVPSSPSPPPVSSPLAPTPPAGGFGFAPPGGFGFAPSSNSKPTSPPARKRPNFAFVALMDSPAPSPGASGITTPSKESEEKGFAMALHEKLGEQESRMIRRLAMEESQARADNPLESYHLEGGQAQARSDVSGDTTVGLGKGEVGASKSDEGGTPLPDLDVIVGDSPDRESSADVPASSSSIEKTYCTSPASSSSLLPHPTALTSTSSTSSTSSSDADPPTPSLTNASLDSSPSPSPSPYTLDLHYDHGYSSAGSELEYEHDGSSYYSSSEIDASSTYGDDEMVVDSHPRIMGDSDVDHEGMRGGHHHHHGPLDVGYDVGYVREDWGKSTPTPAGRGNFWARQGPGRWTPPAPSTPKAREKPKKKKKQVIVINDIEIELDDEDEDVEDEGNVEDDESSVKGVGVGSGMGSGRATPTSGTPARCCTSLPLSEESTTTMKGVEFESPSTPTHASRETCGEGSPPTPTPGVKWGVQAV